MGRHCPTFRSPTFHRPTFLAEALCAVLLASFGARAGAQEASEPQPDREIQAGHSLHGEVFNEGARQAAYLMEQTGRVRFEVTTSNPEAQKFVSQGLGQVYGFWYFEAERSFRQAAALDPECAMAYWGMALANMKNDRRAKGFIAEAVKRKDKVSEREKLYIAALNDFINVDAKKKKTRGGDFARALEKLILKFPADVEAKAMLTLQLYGNRSEPGGIGSYLALDALMGEVFDVEPLHPAHHFRIHLWDYEQPEKALQSAALCGQSAPSIAHMWHMPGHIYSRLKRYPEAAWQQEASARTDHAHMMRDGVLPDQIHNFAHNNEWLIRDLIFVGRAHDAVSLAKNMIELPRHPKYNTLAKRGGSASYGRMRLLSALEQFELWEDAIALCQGAWLEPTDDVKHQLDRLKLLCEAHFRMGDLAGGDAVAAEYHAALSQLQRKQKQAVERAGNVWLSRRAPHLRTADINGRPLPPVESTVDKQPLKPDEQKTLDKLRADAGKPMDADIKSLEAAAPHFSGWSAFARKDYPEALKLLTKARADALALAQIQMLAGQSDEALKAIEKHVGAHKNEVLPLACQVVLLWKAEQRDAAKEAFQKLKGLSGAIDLDTRPFQRLAPIAEEIGLGSQWQQDFQFPEDFGERPELASLGPFRWTPPQAPAWVLPNSEGSPVDSKQLLGEPTVLIFYLGYGCLHCAEQLHKFAPLKKQFEDAGLRMIAVSTDDLEGLKQSIADYKGGLPIPLLADPKLQTFKAFRCFDDFERTPLHGTFVLDRDGRIRWQDISFEPFMDPQFVLDEAQRLLRQ